MSQSPLNPTDEPTGIFINYRRADTSGHAGRLEQELSRRFPGRVFMDIHTIEVGTDFADAINSEVGKCGALIVLIGNQWVDITDPKTGKRRLDNPNDFVALEIAEALKRNTRVIPVLVEGAKMPDAEELPASLAALVRRNAIEISDTRWDYDVQQLIKVLEKICGLPTPSATGTETGSGKGTGTGTRTGTGSVTGVAAKSGMLKIAIPVAVVLVAVVALVIYLSSGSTTPSQLSPAGSTAPNQSQAQVATDNAANPPGDSVPATRLAIVDLSAGKAEFIFPFVTTGDEFEWYLKDSPIDEHEYHWEVIVNDKPAETDYRISLYLQKGKDDAQDSGNFESLIGQTGREVSIWGPDNEAFEPDEEFAKVATIKAPIVKSDRLTLVLEGEGVKRIFGTKPEKVTFRILTPDQKKKDPGFSVNVAYK